MKGVRPMIAPPQSEPVVRTFDVYLVGDRMRRIDAEFCDRNDIGELVLRMGGRIVALLAAKQWQGWVEVEKPRLMTSGSVDAFRHLLALEVEHTPDLQDAETVSVHMSRGVAQDVIRELVRAHQPPLPTF